MVLRRRGTGEYSSDDLCRLLGLSRGAIERLVRAGVLRRDDSRFHESDLRCFLHLHPDKYDLRRVNQFFFKVLLLMPTISPRRRKRKEEK